VDISHPINSLIPSLAGEILEVLAGTTRPLSGREVSRLVPSGASHSGVATALGDLANSGLVDQVEAGNAILNTLNREHLLAPLVVAAAGGYMTVLSRIAESVVDLEPAPSRAVLFGSVSRRDAGPDSDIDIAFIFDDDTDLDTAEVAVSALARHVESLTGNRVDAILYTSAEFSSLAQTSPELAAAIGADGRDLLTHAF
jgi:predicted nucleotidyltransferase